MTLGMREETRSKALARAGRKNLINTARLDALMERDRLDAVVVRSGANVTYLSGVVYPGTLARLQDLTDSARGVLVVWPRKGEPVIVTNSIAAGLTRRDTWLDRVEIYEGYVESPYAKVSEVLASLGLEKGCVGFEAFYVSAGHWEEVARRLPNLSMIDCTAMMDEVRWIKTDAEVAAIKRAADLLDDAFLEMFGTVKVGHSERDAHSMLVAACLDKGAGWAHGILNASTNTIPYAGEGDTVFQPGDAMRTDYVAYWDGYPGHQSRSLVFGAMTAEQEAEYRTNREIYLASIDRCRAGARSGDIFDFVMAEFEKAGWMYGSLLVGHSVGPWWHQQEPILARGSDLVLEPGMVIAMEPHYKHWHLQDMVLVTEDEPKLLSDKITTEEPYVVD